MSALDPENIISPEISGVDLDEASCARAGALAAYQFGPQEICDVLQITAEQVLFAKGTVAYAEAFADKAREKAMQQIDISDGWDGVEANAIAKVLAALKHSEDPKYALLAAGLANKAKRRTGMTARTIDANRVGGIVHISLNQKFVTNVQNNGGQINVENGSQTGSRSERSDGPDTNTRAGQPQLPKKIRDMPTPKQVTDLLAPSRPLLEKMRERKIDAQFEELNFGEVKPDVG